jgi:hypothetical protein
MKGDEALWVKFERRSVPDIGKSYSARVPLVNDDGSYKVTPKGQAIFITTPGSVRTEGRETFKDVDFVTIRVPGENDILAHEVKPDPMNQRCPTVRWPKLWAAYKATQDQDAAAGIPLVTLTQTVLQPTMLHELNHAGVRTVEQLLGMSDVTSGRFMGLLEVKRRAAVWFEEEKDRKSARTLEMELAKRDAELASLRASMEELRQASMSQPEAKPSRRNKDAA